MDFSKHVTDLGVVDYAYYEYELLDVVKREAQKGELRCYGCSAPTKFVQSSINGRQAHFGLMQGVEHESFCPEVKLVSNGATNRRKHEEKHYIEAVEQIRNSSKEIDIDTSSKAQFETLIGSTSPNSLSGQKYGQRNGNGRPAERHTLSSDNIRNSKKNLIQLLKFCLYSSRFLKDEGLKLNFKGRSYLTNLSIKQFFQVGSIQNIKRPYFFFGSIRGVDDSLTYIHVGASRTRVVIDEAIRQELWNALKVDQFWQLLDAQIICFGWLKKRDDKYFIVVKDIADIALIDVKTNVNFAPSLKDCSTASTETIVETEGYMHPIDKQINSVVAVPSDSSASISTSSNTQNIKKNLYEPILVEKPVVESFQIFETKLQSKTILEKRRKSLFDKVLSFLLKR
jgi:hypothetical protein